MLVLLGIISLCCLKILSSIYHLSFFLNTCLHEFMCTNAPGVSLWAEESLEEELELQAVVIHYMDDGN